MLPFLSYKSTSGNAPEWFCETSVPSQKFIWFLAEKLNGFGKRVRDISGTFEMTFLGENNSKLFQKRLHFQNFPREHSVLPLMGAPQKIPGSFSYASYKNKTKNDRVTDALGQNLFYFKNNFFKGQFPLRATQRLRYYFCSCNYCSFDQNRSPAGLLTMFWLPISR